MTPMYFDPKEKSLYFPSNRNGSSLIDNICHSYNLLQELSLYDALAIANEDPNIKIYIPFRDPIVRFKSGLTVNFFRMAPENILESGSSIRELLPTSYSSQYASHITYLRDLYSKNIEPVYDPYFEICPYHLYDVHLDHSLYRPLILLLHDYNVQLVPMNKLSEHLAERFVEATPILGVNRANTFSANNEISKLLWEIYKEIFVDTIEILQNQKQITWKLWMDQEVHIFKTFCTYIDTPNMTYCANKLLKNIYKNGFYFSDRNSMVYKGTSSLLNEIQQHKKLHPWLVNYYNANEQHKTVCNAIGQQAYVNPSKI
jgi:hypothetical protein